MQKEKKRIIRDITWLGPVKTLIYGAWAVVAAGIVTCLLYAFDLGVAEVLKQIF